MTVRLQEFIHKYEVGKGNRYLTFVLGLIVMVGVAVVYNIVAYRNLSTPEGMDAAQVARRLAEGKGFSTGFIRPFSLYLLQKHQLQRERTFRVPGTSATQELEAPLARDWARLRGNHPDLANGPVYPLLLAGVLKLMPFDYPELAAGESFRVYLPDLWIGLFNQALLLVLTGMVFWLARKLFDESVAWVSAAVVVGTELFWRYSLSGLSTVWLMLVFAALAGVLASLDMRVRPERLTHARSVRLAIMAGLILGIGTLTRYSFGWLVIPAAIFLATLPHPSRTRCLGGMLLAFAALVAPWLVRNYLVCGAPFGTAGFAIYQGTSQFAGSELERMLTPEFGLTGVADYWLKLLVNLRELIQSDLLKLGGSWITPLFLAGLLVPFRNPTLGRLRWFVAGSLLVLGVAQALGQTGEPAGTAAGEISANHLLLITAPLVFVYGVSLLFSLLEQFTVPGVRYPLAGMVCVIAAAPLLLNFVLPSASPLAYPPYYPPWIQAKSRWLDKQEWMAADIPWAVAWYGQRQSVWLPLKYSSRAPAREDFYALNQLQPLKGLYLSAESLKRLDTRAVVQWRETETEDRDWKKFQSLIRALATRVSAEAGKTDEVNALREVFKLADLHWVRGGGEDWESFVVGVIINQEVPTGFPLKYAPAGLWPEIFLTENEHGG